MKHIVCFAVSALSITGLVALERSGDVKAELCALGLLPFAVGGVGLGLDIMNEARKRRNVPSSTNRLES